MGPIALKTFTMLELLSYHTNHPTTTQALDLCYVLALFVYAHEVSMTFVARIGNDNRWPWR